jgi:pilus assembly protein CpaC
VPIATGGVQGGTAITIEWKEFGVKVNFLPTIVDSGIINLEVAPEVSSLDYSNGVEISGFRIPAIRARKAHTVVELKDGETLVIGGLIMEEEIKVRERMPILGHIPLLGYLFSSTDTRKSETELVLVVSPHIIQAMPPGAQALLPKLTDEDHKKITGW